MRNTKVIVLVLFCSLMASVAYCAEKKDTDIFGSKAFFDETKEKQPKSQEGRKAQVQIGDSQPVRKGQPRSPKVIEKERKAAQKKSEEQYRVAQAKANSPIKKIVRTVKSWMNRLAAMARRTQS